VPEMSLGEHATLRISAACGYGAQGSPPVIPPNADLVFDVQLNAINGRRASPTAPMITAPQVGLGLSLGTPLGSVGLGAAVVTPPPALPECTESSCGHAISFDTTGSSRPLCLCNPICQSWASTPGILPCCPKLQEICLDPLRSPSPQPPAPVAMAMAPLPMASIALPTCRPGSCGKGMAAGVNSMTAICACDVSCLAPGSSLPCCQSFKQVCQSPPIAAAINVAVAAPILQQAVISAPVAMQRMPQAAQPIIIQKPVGGCMLGKMKWAEQPTCDKKRYAIQGGACKKVCPAIDPQSGIKFYPKGPNGKKACAAALALCN